MKKRHVPEVGNVYPAKGGYGRGTPDMWVVISIVGNDADLIGKKVVLLWLKKDCSIVSSAAYNAMAVCEEKYFSSWTSQSSDLKPRNCLGQSLGVYWS